MSMVVIGAEHKYAKAIVKYSKALELSPTNVKLLANRAFAHLKLENYGSAVEDSSKAIELDATFIKVFNFFPLSPTHTCRYPLLIHSIHHVSPSRLTTGEAHHTLPWASSVRRSETFARCVVATFNLKQHCTSW